MKAVELRDGNVIEAPTVIAACDPHTVLVNWIDEAPVSAKSLISRWQKEPAPEGYESKLDGIVQNLPTYKFMSELTGNLITQT